MAKSNAKKMREHAARNGARNPELFRGDRPDISVHTRKTPTRLERISRTTAKHKARVLDYA